MTSVKRVLGAAGAAAIVPVIAAGAAAGAVGVRDTLRARERPSPGHRRGRRCPDAGTVARSGRSDRRRHAADPADGPAVVDRVGRSLRAASAELDEAVRFYDSAGWLDDHTLRHPAPHDVPDGAIAPLRGGLEEFTFDSGWDPVDGEPGAERWRSFSANRRVPVRLLRHPGGPRPWLVAVHGQSMGRVRDHRMLRVRRLHEELGVNVALPVLPLHGPRAEGFAPDRMFVSNVYPVNNVLGLTQSMWDLRRLLLVAPRRPGRAGGRRPRPVARLVRVQPPVDARGRPGLRDRARPPGRPGSLAAGGRAGGAVETPPAPGALRRAGHDRPPARLAARRPVPRAEGTAIHRGRPDRPDRLAGRCGRAVAALGRAVDPLATARPPHHRSVVGVRRTPLVHPRVERARRRPLVAIRAPQA